MTVARTRRRGALGLALGLATAALLAAALAASLPSTARAETARVRAIWVWETTALFHASARARFLETAREMRLTDAYLYLSAQDYENADAAVATLVAALAGAEIRAWGLDGWRGYLSDVEGPGELYAAADALIAFNARHAAGFVGFQSNVEPQDGQGVGAVRFHDGIRQEALTRAERADRDALMTEWLEIHAALAERTARAGLAYGAALPSWLDDYYGAPIEATFRGVRQPIAEHLIDLVDQFVIMSYRTDVEAVLARVEGEMRLAHERGLRRVLFALETHPGPGTGVSYADTPGKATRSAVLADLDAISERLAARFPGGFAGYAIHDWEGVREMGDVTPR